MVLPQNRHMDQQNWIESEDINPHDYDQFITIEARIYSGEKTGLFNKWC